MTVLARDAKERDAAVSSVQAALGLTQTKNAILASPLRASCIKYVRVLLRYGTYDDEDEEDEEDDEDDAVAAAAPPPPPLLCWLACCLADSVARAAMTSPRAERDWLMEMVSFSCCPSTLECAMRSLPARSTK